MKDELLRLAAICEKAEGADRDIDRSIAQAQGWRHFLVQKDIWWHAADGRAVADPPRYTASIDAALTLVPEGLDWIIGRTNDGLTVYAEVGGTGGDFTRFAATPALAICAAALKARASMEKTDG